RPDAVGPDHDRCAVVDVVERLDGLDAEPLEVADDALVVDDLAQRVRQLAGGRRLLGLVDRLADAVAKAGPLRDSDGFDGSHTGSSIACAPFAPDRAACGSVRGQRSTDGLRGTL